MIESLQRITNFFSQYPTWVIILSLLLFSSALSLLIIFKPKTSNINKATNTFQKLDKTSSVLVVSSKNIDESNHSINIIREVWQGPVTLLHSATHSTLLDEMKKDYPIIYFDTEVSESQLKLKDRYMSSTNLKDVLSINDSGVSLVILSLCKSFSVGKALEKSNIQSSIVFTENLSEDIKTTFNKEFCEQFSKGSSLNQAYDKAIIATNVKHNIQAEEYIMLSIYKKE